MKGLTQAEFAVLAEISASGWLAILDEPEHIPADVLEMIDGLYDRGLMVWTAGPRSYAIDDAPRAELAARQARLEAHAANLRLEELAELLDEIPEDDEELDDGEQPDDEVDDDLADLDPEGDEPLAADPALTPLGRWLLAVYREY